MKNVVSLRDQCLLHKTLVSQDAGWYRVGEPRGGKIRPYDTLFTQFVPALRAHGFTQEELDKLLIDNPADAFSIRVRAER